MPLAVLFGFIENLLVFLFFFFSGAKLAIHFST